MSISESQLQVWSNQGAVVSAQNTHNSIREALASYSWPDGVRYDPYLQGSYRNSTNIYGNSDVDLVVELTSVYWCNLSIEEKTRLGWEIAAYGLDNFHNDVTAALGNYYGYELLDMSGDKSIKLLPASGRLKADVVICGSYWYYENQKVRAEGIIIWPKSGFYPSIVNYPKIHYSNGAKKNSDLRTRGRYRITTRIFKNARDKITNIQPELIGEFPSYFIECLLYNIPDNCFWGSFQNAYCSIVDWLSDRFDRDQVNEFICQNEMFYLFGTDRVQWNVYDARQFVTALIDLWNNW
jgi:hypothetical protein